MENTIQTSVENNYRKANSYLGSSLTQAGIGIVLIKLHFNLFNNIIKKKFEDYFM